jgi:hypothetical protein
LLILRVIEKFNSMNRIPVVNVLDGVYKKKVAAAAVAV